MENRINKMIEDCLTGALINNETNLLYVENHNSTQNWDDESAFMTWTIRTNDALLNNPEAFKLSNDEVYEMTENAIGNLTDQLYNFAFKELDFKPEYHSNDTHFFATAAGDTMNIQTSDHRTMITLFLSGRY